MGGIKYVIFWLVLALVGGVWLFNKTIADKKGLAIWQQTNVKLDRIIQLLEDR